MSNPNTPGTPEEQQPQAQGYGPRDPDPYGTQTWQADTWDTGYQPVQQPVQPPVQQPVQPRLGAVPGQTAAPEGWFRDEVPAAPAPAPAAAPVQDWAAQTAYLPPVQEAPPSAAETAYLPPYPGPADPEPQPGPPGQQFSAPAVPEGWFRDEAPAAPAPASAAVQDWAAETAYLPPVQGGAPLGAAETAYLPPVQEAPPSAAETAYLPPVQESPLSAAETAYLPPVAPAGPGGTGAVPDGWFRDEAPVSPAPARASAAAPGPDWAETTAYLPPQAAPEETPQPVQPPHVPHTPHAHRAAADAAPAAQPAPGEEPEYSPATLGGNTMRAVDPARARAEGLSPIIDPGPQSAILTAALGLLLAGAAAVADLALLAPLVVLQGLTAAGWFRLNGMWPARQGIALAFLGALVADGAVFAVDEAYGPGAIIGTLGVWVLLTLVLQLRSQADPDERMYGLMASVASAALAIACAGYLAADSAAVTVGAAAVAVAAFVRAVPLPPAASVGVSLAAAAGAGVAVGGLTSIGVGGALLGLAAGVCALIGLRVAAYDYPSKFVHMTAGVALPLAAAAPAVYLIGRVVG